MVKTYYKDGTAEGVLYAKSRSLGVNFVMPQIPFRSKWRVVGDVVETYDIQTDAPGIFDKNEIIRDQLLQVSGEKIVSRSISSGKLEYLKRIR